MTPQEIFTTVLNHMRDQKVASWDVNLGCRYRGPNGTRCAVGVFIPDEHYNPRMETKTFATLFDNPHMIKAPWAEIFYQNADLMKNLQSTHDLFMPKLIGDSMDKFERQMEKLADRLGLEMA